MPGPPFKICAPHFMFSHWLLHKPNVVLKICLPLLVFDPLLRNSGEGPAATVAVCRCIPNHAFSTLLGFKNKLN